MSTGIPASGFASATTTFTIIGNPGNNQSNNDGVVILITIVCTLSVAVITVGVVAARRGFIDSRPTRQAKSPGDQSERKSLFVNLTSIPETSSLYSRKYGVAIPGDLEYASGADYMILGQFAAGGQSHIHELAPINDRLTSESRGHQLLLKVIHADLSKVSEKSQQMFLQELALTHHFNDNPHVVKLYGWSRMPAALILKRYELGDLRTFINGRGPVIAKMEYTKRNVVAVIRQVGSVLVDMHRRGFVHSDVKTSNILVEINAQQEMHAVLSDFGIARILEPTAGAALDFKIANINGVSIAYASPELIIRFNGKNQTEFDSTIWQRGDVYSLAIVISEMLNRRLWAKGNEVAVKAAQAMIEFDDKAAGSRGLSVANQFKENPLYQHEFEQVAIIQSDFFAFPGRD